MKTPTVLSLAAALSWACATFSAHAADSSILAGTQPNLEVVAASDMRPGNVAVSAKGRVFATFHALGNPKIQLGEVKDGRIVPYPNLALQKNGAAPSDATFDAMLGLSVDRRDRLWVIDMGLNLGKTRLWAFDLRKNAVIEKIELPIDVAPKGSFLQDFVIDEKRGWAYLADIADPGIVALNLKTGKARRFGGHASLQAQDIDMVIDGRVVQFNGKPARVAIDPITLSADRDTLYFGAMNGTTWYQLPTRLLREGADDAAIGAAIKPAGKKPISDGALTDAAGAHYFTDVQAHAIVRIDRDGSEHSLVRDPRLQWPDNISFGPRGWIYVSANQLDTTPSFTGGADKGKPPYYLYRFMPR
jgi:sugar lactone lactonase YvrE